MANVLKKTLGKYWQFQTLVMVRGEFLQICFQKDPLSLPVTMNLQASAEQPTDASELLSGQGLSAAQCTDKTVLPSGINRHSSRHLHSYLTTVL